MNKFILSTGAVLITALVSLGNPVTVGKATYSDTFPGIDKAGRNSFPQSDPYLSGKAAERPVPSNEWWSNEVSSPFGHSIFNYPLALRTVSKGLVIINNLKFQAITTEQPITIGLEGLNVPNTTVSDYSDWTVTLNWKTENSSMNATIGMGMPFVYFSKEGNSNVSITLTSGSATIHNNVLSINGSYNGGCYLIFAPSGSQWVQSGNTFTSDLDGKNYWSAIMLPPGSNPSNEITTYSPYAFVFPSATYMDMTYDSSKGEVRNLFKVIPDIKEGTSNTVLMGLLPHHFKNLSSNLPQKVGHDYATVRGTLQMYPTNTFETTLKYYGLLPYLPTPENREFSIDELKRLVKNICDKNGFDDWTDSYNDGQLLHRLVQTAESAKSSGDNEGFELAFNLVKSQLERWMTYKEGDVAFLFYYHKPWNSMLGYPAGHGQDSNLNDHNFHWGYFIRAAAFIAQYDKEWVNNYGDFINLLVRDVASNDRNDSMFPYLRAFSPYAGHCWANGTASLSLGNDQESTSEAMLFNTALILWGDVIGNKEMRDLGVCLYANEYASIREYWLDVDKTNLDPSFHSVLASRVFGNAYDDENFWGGGIAGSYGIQIYPLQSGSFYFMNDPEYVERLWAAMTDETGILRDEDNPNIWYDTWIRFIAMKNPEVALDLYSKTKHLGEKFGESQAYTYQWIHALEIFGQPNMSIYASHPLAMVFENDGVRTYIARNNNSEPISVIFSDGKTMTVDANTLYYEQEGEQNPSVSFFSLENRYSLNKVYTLNAKVRIPNESDIKVDDVEFFINNNSIGKGYSNDGVLYTIDWTPTILGKNYIKAILSCDDENKYSSQVCEINVVDENTPEELSCIFTDTEATEGSFNAPYTVTCTTKGRNVEILFSCSGNYQGFVGPYLFDETNGFREIMMNEVSKGLYKITLSGLEDGTYIRFRVKIAYTAGLGITKQFTYKVGSFCETSGIEEIYLVNGDIQFNSISSKNGWTITGHCPGAHMTLWGADGKLIREFKYDSDSFFVDNTNLSNGIYLLHVSTPNAQKSLKLVK